MSEIDFLFEIGTEEIPAGYISNAMSKLKDSFTTDLTELKLNFKEIKLYSTPRRMAIKIIGLNKSQKDETIEKVGPAKKVGYNENGSLTKAGEGFLKGTGVDEKDIYTIDTPKGEYLAAKIFTKGKETKVLLPQMMKNALERIVFPKTMKWGQGSFMFARPIRWIVALYDMNSPTHRSAELRSACKEEEGGNILDFEFEGIRAGNISWGNRYQGLDNKIEVKSTEQYPDVLKQVKVIADREERKNSIIAQISMLTAGNAGVSPASTHDSQLTAGNAGVSPASTHDSQLTTHDSQLINTVTDLVEFPTAVKASFSKEYLELPPKIISSTLSQNQKYFTITDKDGNLTNEFIFISNGNPDYSELIKKGNEKVVKARLDDARFYFQEDTKRPLEDYVEKLSEVVFQAKLGTMLDKTNRVVALCEYITNYAPPMKYEGAGEGGVKESILRAARLSKADLVTLMLSEKEFTALQGYIGMNYALLSSETPEVAKAIYEHYMPRGQKDDLPSEITGAILAIADKLDTVCGIIGIGLMPTGSADPFAIRRAANGIVQIIDKFGIELSLKELISFASKQASPMSLQVEGGGGGNETIKYFKQRIKWLLEEIYHIDYDVLDALDIFDWDNVINIKNRAMALQEIKGDKNDFEILVSGFKRVSNILDKNSSDNPLNPEILTDENEKKLYQHLLKIKNDIQPLLEKMAYKEVLLTILPIGADIDSFFDKVLVMSDDISLKNNRLALLKEIKTLFLNVADISKINYVL